MTFTDLDADDAPEWWPQITFEVSAEIYQQAVERALTEGISIPELARRAIARDLAS